MLNNHFEITYKLVAKSPILLSHLDPSRVNIDETLMYIPGSSMKGLTRHELSKIDQLGIEHFAWEEAKESFFGTLDDSAAFSPSHIFFSDAVCTNPTSTAQIKVSVMIDREKEFNKKIFPQAIAPINTEFIGKVVFTKVTNGLQRSIALSWVLNILRGGGQISRGYGDWEIEIVDRNSTIIFISYVWESNLHKKWVRNFAQRLLDEDDSLTIILDQFSPSFHLKLSQVTLNIWMRESVQNSDKVLAILTPTYRYKAENGIGGVGYEYGCLCEETGVISNKLKRYIGILRDGTMEKSVPHYFKNNPIIDMREKFIDIKSSSLIEIIKS